MSQFYWDDMTAWRRWWHTTTEKALLIESQKTRGVPFMTQEYYDYASLYSELDKQTEQACQELWDGKGYKGSPTPGWKPERENDRSTESLGTFTHIPHHELGSIDYQLNGYETVLDVSVAVNKEIAQRFGRGAGEGRLIVTDQNLLHVPDSGTTPTSIFVLIRGEVASVTRHWIPMPTMSELVVQTVHDESANFYLNTKASRRVVALLSAG